MRFPGHELLKRRRTKIVATIGPACHEPAMIERLVKAGVNVFRLNMSHGDHAFHRCAHERIRAVASALGEPVATMADLCGPKMRVGRFPAGKIGLAPGQRVVVTTRDVPGEPGLIPSQYQDLHEDVYAGDRILLDDGLIELKVEDVAGTEVVCSVVHGGTLKDCKGMNLPGVNVSAPAMTDKDWEDARFSLGLGVDFLALSFVRRAAHVSELQEFVRQSGVPARIIAKIEMPEALEEIDAILDVSDSIMVARGDLGVELPPELVPIAQRQLVVQARARHRPVIVATQMLESMVEHPRPTRAEVSDVSTAVFAGADAVMLSAETASGAYPVEAVEVMDRVARRVEACLWAEGAFGGFSQFADLDPPIAFQPAIGRTIAQLSRDLRVRTVVVHSESGTTANVASAARPAAPVVAASALAHTCRQMNLLWGVIPVQLESAEPAHELAPRLARQLGLAEAGQYVLALGGVGDNSKRQTPIVTVTALRVE